MPFHADDSDWPVVLDGFEGRPTDEDIRRHNERRAERLSREARHVQIVDGRCGMRMSAAHRKTIADFDREHRDGQRRYLAGVALVTPSAALRAILTVVYRLTPSVCPRKPCSSIDEARAWARELLQEPDR